MELSDAIELGIVSVKDGQLIYKGMCNECKYSECHAYPATSNMCMNKESEWYGAYHVDYSLHRYVDGCWAFKKKIV